ncbi:MAG: ABC transporter permease [Micropepsaceae bacterium]
MNWTTIRLALRELRANKLRTFLTCLGMIIGVGSVIALVTIGAGVTAQITSTLESLGNNLIFAFPGGPDAGGRGNDSPFDRQDIEALRHGVPGIVDISPSADTDVEVTFGGYTANTEVEGGEASIFRIGLWGFAEGRGFTTSEEGRSVCVLGKTVRDKLFASGPAVGQRIRLGRVPCEVIGVLKPKGTSFITGDQDDRIFMPMRAYLRRIQGNTAIFNIQISAATREDVPRVMEGIRAALRQSRGVGMDSGDNFTVRDLQGFVEEAQNIFGFITLFVAAVAFISLIVGGIGIMNIMLVSVTERTREIGIRLAIGAQERDVLMQFLTEAAILAMLGGLIGVVFGLGIAVIGVSVMGAPFLPSIGVIIGATLFSAAFGLSFGFFPARRAAKMNPIDALRYE